MGLRGEAAERGRGGRGKRGSRAGEGEAERWREVEKGEAGADEGACEGRINGDGDVVMKDGDTAQFPV